MNEAAKRLKPEVTCTFTEDVQIFLTGGMPVNIELLEKDDEIYFAFDGGDLVAEEADRLSPPTPEPPGSP